MTTETLEKVEPLAATYETRGEYLRNWTGREEDLTCVRCGSSWLKLYEKTPRIARARTLIDCLRCGQRFSVPVYWLPGDSGGVDLAPIESDDLPFIEEFLNRRGSSRGVPSVASGIPAPTGLPLGQNMNVAYRGSGIIQQRTHICCPWCSAQSVKRVIVYGDNGSSGVGKWKFQCQSCFHILPGSAEGVLEIVPLAERSIQSCGVEAGSTEGGRPFEDLPLYLQWTLVAPQSESERQVYGHSREPVSEVEVVVLSMLADGFKQTEMVDVLGYQCRAEVATVVWQLRVKFNAVSTWQLMALAVWQGILEGKRGVTGMLSLNDKDIALLTWLSQGKSIGYMAQQLDHKQKNTTKKHTTRLKVKLGARTLEQAVAIACRAGIITEEGAKC